MKHVWSARAFAERPLRAMWLLSSLFAFAAEASKPMTAPEYPRSDERYKADILLIVAHPDDDTAIAGYLAREIFDEHRRVAVIYTTRGDAGGNAVGSALGNALGAEREIEARRAMGSFGVTNVWFQDALDGLSGNVVGALAYINHGSILGQVVRLVRLTRPEVIITWLPLPVAGENHADHQAASVIASEAFDLAGDPSAFAEQVTSAKGDGRDPEGLHPWQPKKIYYFSDAFDYAGYWQPKRLIPSPYRKNFLEGGAGPAYSNTDVSPAKGVPYAQLSAEETSFYLTQEGAIGKEALMQGDFKAFETPNRFVLGKSLVGGTATGDIFERINSAPIAFVPPPGVPAETRRGVSLELGGPWEFYRVFWKAHALDRLADLLPTPEISIGPGGTNEMPLVVRNDTGTAQKVTLRAVLPDGWVEKARYSIFPLSANSAYPVYRVLTVPPTSKPGWYEVAWKAEAEGRQIGEVTWRVYVIGLGSP
jgi:LmbE family N-acetylglucosaminyl deacetylase